MEYSLLADFAQNFSIDQNYPLDTYMPYALTVDIQLDEKDQTSVVDFYYVYAYTTDGVTLQAVCIPYHFSGFGATNIPQLDSYLASLG